MHLICLNTLTPRYNLERAAVSRHRSLPYCPGGSLRADVFTAVLIGKDGSEKEISGTCTACDLLMI